MLILKNNLIIFSNLIPQINLWFVIQVKQMIYLLKPDKSHQPSSLWSICFNLSPLY